MKIKYDEAYECYLEVAKTRKLSYPLDVFELIHSYGIKTVSYTKLAKISKTSLSDVLQCMPEYGQLAECNGKYIIHYNDQCCNGTIRFTLLHELGHYLMKHPCGDGLSDDEIKRNENLANCFARNILAPLTLCNTLGLETIYDIANYFKISTKASIVRLETMNQDSYYLKKVSKKMDIIPKIMYVEYKPTSLPF